jgi:hypothetical protein
MSLGIYFKKKMSLDIKIYRNFRNLFGKHFSPKYEILDHSTTSLKTLSWNFLKQSVIVYTKLFSKENGCLFPSFLESISFMFYLFRSINSNSSTVMSTALFISNY